MLWKRVRAILNGLAMDVALPWDSVVSRDSSFGPVLVTRDDARVVNGELLSARNAALGAPERSIVAGCCDLGFFGDWTELAELGDWRLGRLEWRLEAIAVLENEKPPRESAMICEVVNQGKLEALSGSSRRACIFWSAGASSLRHTAWAALAMWSGSKQDVQRSVMVAPNDTSTQWQPCNTL